MPIYLLPEDELIFPDPAWADPNGILAVGGDLSPERLLLAYQNGIFPWYNAGEPILWWSPDPRLVLFPSELKVSKSMRPYFNQKKFEVSFDRDFRAVIQACRENNRKGQGGGTWITREMLEAYSRLHELGYAHSAEVWQDGELAGGLYGLAIGKIFFGESMFTRVSNASKFGFISLVRRLEKQGFRLIDCQQETRHLKSLGARSISREKFVAYLKENRKEEIVAETWIR